jgi:DnaJ-class molecular chaperone
MLVRINITVPKELTSHQTKLLFETKRKWSEI